MPWPPEILTDIEHKLVRDGAALDPGLFSEALLYAYDVLDTYYFPIFVADAVSRNVTRDHCVLRVFVAFMLLWFGFALPLALILLNHQPRAHRAWSVLPQLVGWWNMAVGFGGCDLLLAAMRKYQSPIMKDQAAATPRRPRDKPQWSLRTKLDAWHRAWFSTRISVDMTATRMVRARSVRWFLGALFMTALSTAILCAVPGTHVFK
ncbi:Bud site selection protein, Revert to axial protein 1 [Coemansia spiralis]|nr:Bud site selection protein, Revert to axial protein 1 [Coemansia spiralis]